MGMELDLLDEKDFEALMEEMEPEAEMRKCPKCGRVSFDGSEFCPECGYEF